MANNTARQSTVAIATVFANLINNSFPTSGEVLWGASSSGIKGFYSTVKMEVSSTTQAFSGKIELFAVSSETVESSY